MALTLIVTNAGRTAIINAANTGTAPVTIAQVGLSATALTPLATDVALPGEFKRLATLSGDVVDDDTIHVVVRDESTEVFTVRSMALYLNDGTLFGIYGQAAVLIEKSAQAMMLLGIDVRFEDIDATDITFGDANFLNPPATTEQIGVVELATIAEAQAGIDALRALTPATAKAAILGWLLSQDGAGSGIDADLLDGQQGSYYSDVPARLGFTPVNKAGDMMTGLLTLSGDPTAAGHAARKSYVDALVTAAALLAKLVTVDGAGSGLDSDLLDGQQGSYYADIVARLGFTPVDKAGDTMTGLLTLSGDPTAAGHAARKSYVDALVTAAALLAKLVTVDGAGSGLDSDLLDGQQGSYYADIVARLGYTPLNSTSYTAADVKAKLLTVDGAGSGVDSDLLDGQNGSYYADIVARLGYTPVRQGGGSGQLGNTVYIGWSGSRMKMQVDASDLGNVVFDGNISDVWRSSNDGSGSGMDADMVDGWHRDSIRDWNNLLNKPWNWSGQAGQPSWLWGGNADGAFYVYNPSNFNVNYANSAGSANSAGTLSNSPGSAPHYACRAWVNFNGKGVVAIRGSGNVSSITDGGTGIYTVNLTTALPDTNAAVSINTNWNASNTGKHVTADLTSSSTIGVRTWSGDSASLYDFSAVYVSVFR